MTQPTPTPHLTTMDHTSEQQVSVRRSSVVALGRWDGGFDYDTGLPTQFAVVAMTLLNQGLRVATFGTAEDRDDYIANDPDGLLA